jgi:nitrite reductase/ring-hydroxylating ferredoxin subunit
MTQIDETTSNDAPGGSRSADARGLSRRTMVRGVTVGGLALPLLAACGGGEDSGGGATPEAADSATPAESSSAADGGGGGAAAGTTVATSDVPVGGGAILKDEKVVVTQPSEGEYKAFDATCTHQGCLVGEVTGGEIVCPCHDSHFSITDGSPVSGPASSPLATKKVAVKGSRITVT